MVMAIAEDDLEITIIKHQKMESGYFYKHQALIDVVGEASTSEIVEKTSEKLGFNKERFGIYNENLLQMGGAEQRYIAKWETETYV